MVRVSAVTATKGGRHWLYTHPMFNEYPNQRAVITGGASGLGKAMASLLLAAGWKVGIADNNPAHLADTAGTWREHSGRVFAHQVDVTDPDSVQRVADDFARRHGGVDLVANCAGIGAGGAFDTMSLTDFSRVMDVNFKGVLHSCRAFVPLLRRQGSGLIVNVASAAAFSSAPEMSAYNVSKAAVVSLTETLQAEYARRGLRFAVVMTTFFRSNLHQTLVAEGANRTSAERMIAQAKVDAPWVAAKALRKINRGKFYVVLPADARALWFVKRHFPGFFLRIVGRLAEKQYR